MTTTTTAQLTPTSNVAPAIANVTDQELSGAIWVSRFPGSTSTSTLVPEFQEAVDAFVNALRVAGANVQISATYRPPERAYLMHWSWKIARGLANPTTIPPMANVNIRWNHGNSAASQQAAQAMVNAYGMSGLNIPPALFSRHTQRKAIDMTISWQGTLSIRQSNGTYVEINTTPRTGMNTMLHEVGRTYGVIKYVGGATDKPSLVNRWTLNRYKT